MRMVVPLWRQSVTSRAGKGKPASKKVTGGVVGLVLDGRGRPFTIPAEPAERIQKLNEWHRALEVYPTREPATVS